MGAALAVLAGFGLLAAVALMIERVAVLVDPTRIPSCTLNPILSCSSVMTSPQASAFGFPNPVVGIVGFTVVLTTGVAVLAGARFTRWYWAGLQAGVTFAIVFVHWLAFQSLYRIGALCPYCLVVWAVTIPLFVLVTVHNLRQVPGLPPPARRAVDVAHEYRTAIVVGWYLLIATLAAQRFWDYWITLLP
ncbi:vitamin K epoxide reductase family protein [Actinotalea ferrariae]|uniref:vitamin K epoxide reductase family protein n=1 Tax=Actinotalea ferrariae TaxID=1386098 RepID=UPI001C8C414C|nr:vitamin K epoxide reductase family protein [Actinotalea ferrariae]MBX9243833.1 vitamin K epoxide reductase family protein [Actinotalea ferrariae]